jgi:virginiamycin A acetyltransferase
MGNDRQTPLSRLFFKLYSIKIAFLRKIIIKRIINSEGGDIYSNTLRDIFCHYHEIEIGMYSYGGCFNDENIQPKTCFGKFCSVASNVYVYNRNHPHSQISSHPLFYSKKLGFVAEDKIPFQKKIIGNDVWFGQNSIILANAHRIGNGAIIGAGAVVTKDVPDYAIVVGIPAKIIAFRFKPQEIDWLLQIKWWDWPINEIKRALPYMNYIQKFIDFKSTILDIQRHVD